MILPSNTLNRIILFVKVLVISVVLPACNGSGSAGDPASEDPEPEVTVPGEYIWRLPVGFPEPDLGGDIVMSDDLVSLGRILFYDRRMSINETTSCATCHEQARAFSDGLPVALGALGDEHLRNSPTLTNAVYNASQNWANPNTLTLQAQAIHPMFGESPIIELGWTGNEETIMNRFKVDPDYPNRFAKAFPGEAEPIQPDHFLRAVSAFTATLISGNSENDEIVYQGGSNTVSDSVIRGLGLFFSERLECFHCHGGFNFSSATNHGGLQFNQVQFHNNGLYNVGGRGGYPNGNQGLFDITGVPADRGKFKAPTLRNVLLTAPYMHDGSISTIEEVIDMYARGGRLIESGPFAGDGALSPQRDVLLNGFSITNNEKQDLIAYLGSLTDWKFVCDEQLSDPFGELPMHERCSERTE